MSKLIKIFLALVVIILIIMWSSDHDKKVNEAAENYEQCVKVEYDGMTPSYYYQINGEYPECK